MEFKSVFSVIGVRSTLPLFLRSKFHFLGLLGLPLVCRNPINWEYSFICCHYFCLKIFLSGNQLTIVYCNEHCILIDLRRLMQRFIIYSEEFTELLKAWWRLSSPMWKISTLKPVNLNKNVNIIILVFLYIPVLYYIIILVFLYISIIILHYYIGILAHNITNSKSRIVLFTLKNRNKKYKKLSNLQKVFFMHRSLT